MAIYPSEKLGEAGDRIIEKSISSMGAGDIVMEMLSIYNKDNSVAEKISEDNPVHRRYSALAMELNRISKKPGFCSLDNFF